MLLCFFYVPCYGSDLDLTSVVDNVKHGIESQLRLLTNHEIHVITFETIKSDNTKEFYEIKGVIGGPSGFLTEGRDYDMPNKDYYQRIIGANKKYLFELSRGRYDDDSEKSKSWTIVNIIPQWESIPLAPRLDPVARPLFFAGGIEITDYWTSLDLCSSKCFQALNFQEITSDEGEEIVKISFKINEPVDDYLSKDVIPYKGYLSYYPNRNWLLKEANIFVRGATPDTPSGRVDVTYDFLKRDDNVYYVSKTTANYVIDGNDLPVKTVERTFSVKHLPNLDNSRFTLSHYGLPEPDFGEARPNRIRYIMMVFGGFLVAIAVWQMVQKRREKTA